MSLLHPTPGQCLDRFSILGLKVKAFEGSKRNSGALVEEQYSITEYLAKNFGRGTKNSHLASLELHRVNRELWELEERIRSTGSEDFRELARSAKEIAFLNDKRSKLMREIDDAYGCSAPVEEKIYSIQKPEGTKPDGR